MTDPYAAAEGLVRVYPAREPHGAGLVWAHGGAFAFGDLDMPEADGLARALAARGTTVVSVDYRLVGDGCRYPAPSDDILAAWTWVVGNAARLRIDEARLAIGGASAGANLVTGATLRLLERGRASASRGFGAEPHQGRASASRGFGAEPHQGRAALPALVVLAYPTLHAVQPAPDAALRALLDANPDADRFGPAAVRGMYEDLIGGPVDDAPLAAIPGLAAIEDLASFPPTLMINDEIDELRVSGEHFAATLAAAGREIEVVIEPGAEHGHLNRPHEPAASVSIERIATRLATISAPAIEGSLT